MKPVLFSTIAALVLVGLTTAQAADLARKAIYKAPPPTPIVQSSWTGLYIGAHAGCGWARQTIHRITVEDDEPPETAFVNLGSKSNRCFGGGQVGFNYQLSNNVVVGIEADRSWGSFKSNGSAPEGDEELIPFEQKLKSFGTVRGRLGYANGAWMPYVTGGWAWGRNELTVFAIDDGLTTFDRQTHSGWALGGGVEYMLNRNWSIKAEYLYLDLGSKTYNRVAFFDAEFPGADLKVKISTFRLGVNYRFDTFGR